MKAVYAILALAAAMLAVPACCVVGKLPPKAEMPIRRSFAFRTFDERDVWAKCPEAVAHNKDAKENPK